MVPKVNQSPIRKSCLVDDMLVRMEEQQIRPEDEFSLSSPDDKRRPYLVQRGFFGLVWWTLSIYQAVKCIQEFPWESGQVGTTFNQNWYCDVSMWWLIQTE